MLDLCLYIYTEEKHSDKKKTNNEKATVKHIYKIDIYNVYIKLGIMFIYIMLYI